MDALHQISKAELKEILNKGWMTHDAMWFVSCYQQLGIEKTNQLNLSAIALMSMVEVNRIRKAVGMQDQEFDTFEKLLRFLEGAADLVIPKFMKVSMSSPKKNVIRWKWEDGECFAYKGIVKLGAIDRYRCGVIYRIECWLRALEVRFETVPPVEGCLMHEQGECAGEFRFFFSGG